MELGVWLSLFGICLLGAMSPGPSLAVVMSATLRGGRTAGFAAALAHGLGVALYGLLTVMGLAILVTESPNLYLALQLLGAAYLVYLGIKSLRSGGSSATDINQPGSPASAAQNPWLAGFLVAFLNPKLAVFMLALFSQFLQPHFGLYEKGIMVGTVGLTDTIWYALMAGALSQPNLLQKLRNNAVRIDRFFGVVLIVLALSVATKALVTG